LTPPTVLENILRMSKQDHAEIQRLVRRVYDALSGYSDTDRDWEVVERAHHPRGCVGPGIFEDRPRTVMSPGEFHADVRRRLGDRAFFEWEVEHTAEVNDNVAYVRSAYAAAVTPRGEPIIKSGVNHILLTRTDEGWKILAITWD
jgi:hypothetical protein